MKFLTKTYNYQIKGIKIKKNKNKYQAFFLKKKTLIEQCYAKEILHFPLPFIF
jgi:hypothetical protein